MDLRRDGFGGRFGCLFLPCLDFFPLGVGFNLGGGRGGKTFFEVEQGDGDSICLCSLFAWPKTEDPRQKNVDGSRALHQRSVMVSTEVQSDIDSHKGLR